MISEQEYLLHNINTWNSDSTWPLGQCLSSTRSLWFCHLCFLHYLPVSTSRLWDLLRKQVRACLWFFLKLYRYTINGIWINWLDLWVDMEYDRIMNALWLNHNMKNDWTMNALKLDWIYGIWLDYEYTGTGLYIWWNMTGLKWTVTGLVHMEYNWTMKALGLDCIYGMWVDYEWNWIGFWMCQGYEWFGIDEM